MLHTKKQSLYRPVRLCFLLLLEARIYLYNCYHYLSYSLFPIFQDLSVKKSKMYVYKHFDKIVIYANIYARMLTVSANNVTFKTIFLQKE